MAERRTKGYNLVGLIKAVEGMFGVQTHAAVLAALPPLTRELATDPGIGGHWISLDHLVHAYQAVIAKALNGDVSGIASLSSFQVRSDLSSTARLFLAVISPTVLLAGATALWRFYYDSGRLRVVRSGRGQAVARIEDYPSPHPAFWYDTMGGMEGAAIAAGCRNIRVNVLDGGGADDDWIECEVLWDD